MITFLKEALKNLNQTGSIMESSAFLSRQMVRPMDFSRQLSVVELGAGTGSITRYILKAMGKGSIMTSFEINPVLYRKLGVLDDQRLVKINDDVSRLPFYFEPDSVDHIVSSLPLANICVREKLSVLQSCYRVLKPGGYFMQYQYSLNDLKLIQKKFPKVGLGFTILNIPPAFIYYARKPLTA